MISQRGGGNRAAFLGILATLLVGGLLAGCNNTKDLVGEWRDISVDGAGASVAPTDRERMRHRLTLNQDGSGTYTAGGSPSNATKKIDPKQYPIHWSVSGKYMTVKSDDGKSATFTVNDAHNAIGSDGTAKTPSDFSGDVVSFVRADGGASK